MQQTMDWNETTVAILKRRWVEDGWSATMIARHFATLGYTISRSGVCAKVNRLGLSGSNANPSHYGNHSGVGHPKAVRSRKVKALPAPPAEPEPEPSPVIHESGNVVTLATVTNHSCKWPMWEEGSRAFPVCGHAKHEGSPYCLYHTRKAWVAGGKDKRRTKEERAAALAIARDNSKATGIKRAFGG